MPVHFLLFFAMMLPAQHAVDDPMPVTLETMRDHSRPLLVFAPTDRDPRFLKQVRLFAEAGYEMGQREVLLVPLHAKSEAGSWGVVLRPTENGRMSPEAATAARRLFHIAPQTFTVLLLGKDGGEKLRSSSPITAQTLIRTIDSMPMRQQEMANRRMEPKSP